MASSCSFAPIAAFFEKLISDNVKAVEDFVKSIPSPLCIARGIAADFVNNSMLSSLLESPLGDLYQGLKDGNFQGAVEGIVGARFSDIDFTDEEGRFNVCKEIFGLFLMMFDDLLLFGYQLMAQDILKKLERKTTKTTELQDALRQLHNALVIALAGKPFFSQYLNDLKEAIIHLEKSRISLLDVRNVMVAIGQFQRATFTKAKEELALADKLITPQNREGERRFAKEYTGFISSQMGPLGPVLAGGITPNTAEQRAALLAVPKLCKDVFNKMRFYLRATADINSMLALYEGGVQLLTMEGLFSKFIDRYAIQIMDSSLSNLDNLISDMDTFLKSEKATTSYLPVKGYDWMLQVKAIQAYLMLVPETQLEKLSTDRAALRMYLKSVEDLKKLNAKSGGSAQLRATTALEQPGDLEVKVTKVITTANTVLITRALKQEILQYSLSAIDYCTIVLERNGEITSALTPFATYDFVNGSSLKFIMKTLASLFGKAGFDRALTFLKTGNFLGLLGSDVWNAFAIGAAIAQLLCMEGFLNVLGGLESQRECLGNLRRQLNSRRTVERYRWKPPLMEGCNYSMGPLKLRIDIAFKQLKIAQACAEGAFDPEQVPDEEFKNRLQGQFGGTLETAEADDIAQELG